MSKYRVFIHDIIGTEPADSLLEDVKVVGFSHRINSYGQARLIIPKASPNATSDNLKKFRRVTIHRRKNDSTLDFERVWYGYIESHDRSGAAEIEIICMGMLKLFLKRFAADDEVFNGQGSTEAQDLLTDTNTNDGDTGVDVGTGDVTTTKNVKMPGSDVLRVWEALASAHNAEFEIDVNGDLNFVQSLGADKTSITLIFRKDDTGGSNLKDFEEGEDAEDLINKLIGTSTGDGGLTSTQSDAASQAAYGVLIGKKAFNEAQDQATLDEMTSNTVTQLANPASDNKLIPLVGVRSFNPVTGNREISALDYGDFDIGDLYTVRIVTENQNIDSTKRIAEIEVSVNDEEEEEIRITPTDAGIFITAAFLEFDQIQELKRKIQEIELLL